MGYSTSVKAIIRMRAFLDTLADSTTNVEWRMKDPKKFAYQLREAVHVAKKYSKQYPRYANLYDRFRFHVTKTMVLAQVREELSIEQVNIGRLTIDNVSSALEIVGAALTHKAPIMYFPNASLEKSELDKLRKWATGNEYVVGVANDNMGVYLTRDSNGQDKKGSVPA